MEAIDFSALEAKVDELVAHCDALIRENQKLAQENQKLRDERRAWQDERATLVERNDLAKAKLDAMIERLKSVDEAL